MQHEAVELLSQYLQIDTTNPPGNENKGVEFLAGILEKEGLEYKTFEASPGRSSIKAVFPEQRNPLLRCVPGVDQHGRTQPGSRD